jgi:putative PIN family toxin of toxin-antitoxin system
MIKVVLDTNIVISSLFWKGPARLIVDLAIAGKIYSVTSPEILEEVEAVLCEDFSDIPYWRVEEIIRDILSYSHLVVADSTVVKELRDIRDTKIIACAIAGRADYVITGDKDLLILEEYKGIVILTPRNFLEMYKYEK